MIMLNCVQKVIDVYHQYFPLQNTFCSGNFAVSGVEEPGVVKVHELDPLVGQCGT